MGDEAFDFAVTVADSSESDARASSQVFRGHGRTGETSQRYMIEKLLSEQSATLRKHLEKSNILREGADADGDAGGGSRVTSFQTESTVPRQGQTRDTEPNSESKLRPFEQHLGGQLLGERHQIQGSREATHRGRLQGRASGSR